MIRVEFKKPTPADAFDDWVTRCRNARKGLTSAAGVSEQLYKEQRDCLLGLFHGKCAYCEARIFLDQHKGDVEHYRPKGAVTDHRDVAIEGPDPANAGKVVPHPGYYWLAYECQNLLPSCIACNRPATVSGGRRVGKWNRFPIRGTHAWKPTDSLARERPLLLNPWLSGDDPQKHLVFDPETGKIIGRTDRGRMTVEVLDLNRDGLPEARREVYDEVRARASLVALADVEGARAVPERHVAFLLQHKRGEGEYAMAGRAGLVDARAALQRAARRFE